MQVNKTQANQIPMIKKQPSFGSAAGSSKFVSKLAEMNEYKGFSMSLPTLMVLLYGFTLIPRYMQAYDQYDRREILTRDLVSITSVLFLEKILSKLFADINSKTSGFVLSSKPKGASAWEKFKGYVHPEGKVQVLTSAELESKYKNIHQNKNGIVDFIDYVKEGGGNIKKLFSKQPEVKALTEKILGKNINDASADEIRAAFVKANESTQKVFGKDIRKASVSQIKETFKNAKESSAKNLANIYEIFSGANNPFLKRAKAMNSAFRFLSLFLIVPVSMIQLQKYNERTTKRLRAEHAEDQKKAQEAQKEATAKKQETVNKTEKA